MVQANSILLRNLIIWIISTLLIPMEGNTQTISPSNRVVLPISTQLYLPDYKDKTTRWLPTEKQVDESLASVLKFLRDNKLHNQLYPYYKNQIKKILKHFSNYRVQLVGGTVNRKKRIWLNFFLVDTDFKDWKQRPIIVLDGGYHFWQIEYTIDGKQCINFRVNGSA